MWWWWCERVVLYKYKNKWKWHGAYGVWERLWCGVVSTSTGWCIRVCAHYSLRVIPFPISPQLLSINIFSLPFLGKERKSWAISLSSIQHMVVIVPAPFFNFVFLLGYYTLLLLRVCADKMVCVWFALSAAHRSGGRLFCICCEERERGMHAWWEKIDD